MVDRISSEVEQFEETAAPIKEYAFAAGTPYRYRNMWGCWTTGSQRSIEGSAS